MDPAKSTGKNTTIKTKLFLTLENTVQDYIWTKLKNCHNGHKLRKIVSRCPCNTKHHISERYKYFKMIQEQLDHNIRNMLNTENDHSAPYNETCLQTVKIRYQGGAESSDRGGCCETKGGAVRFSHPSSPHTIPAHNLQNSKTQPSNKQPSHKKTKSHPTA
jgi:hypothetical protein